MALTINSDVTASISLQEYIEFCAAQPDLHDPEKAIATADQLKALANNKCFLADYFNREMKNVDQFQDQNDFKPSTFLLHRGKGYTVRAVIWLPPEEVDEPEIFSYNETHDHNFDFLTCGYHGPGYRTVIYRYEYDRVIGYPGEKVDLEFQEEATLSEGKIMYYYSSKDVHTQLPPPALSISLNLVLPRKERPAKTQYEFDMATRTIKARFGDLQMRRMVFTVVKQIGDANSLDILSTIARRHADRGTRALAWETLMARQPADADEFLRIAMADKSAYVRELTRRAHNRIVAAKVLAEKAPDSGEVRPQTAITTHNPII
jgi:hypothetical protein